MLKCIENLFARSVARCTVFLSGNSSQTNPGMSLRARLYGWTETERDREIEYCKELFSSELGKEDYV
jgi:hypothetical protein